MRIPTFPASWFYGLALLLLALSPAHAQRVGWHFVTESQPAANLGAGETAGFGTFAQSHWNNHVSAGQGPGSPLSNLMDDQGAATTIDVSWTQSTNNSWQFGYNNNPNEKLADCFVDRQPVITIDQIPGTFTGPGYSVVVYYNNNEGPSTSDVKIVGSINDSMTRRIRTGDTPRSSYRSVGFREEAGALSQSTNVTVFTGLNDPKLTISLPSFGNPNNNGISAIQLIAGSLTGPPAIPALLTPADAAAGLSVFPEFDWADSAEVNFYRFKLWPASNPEPTEPTATTPVSDWAVEIPLEYATAYRWRVMAVNSLGESPSVIRNFTTEALQAPPAPANPNPGNASLQVSPGANLVWEQSQRASAYDVYLWANGQAQPGTPTAIVTLNAYDPPANLAPATSYQWKVVAKNAAGAIPGPVWSFTTATDVVTITEFMADNGSTLADENGEPSDWIEIYNPGTAPVNLNGWSLTDKANNLTKWRFPAVTLSPDAYLVVFASEKDRRNPESELHTNFKLSSDGEYLALVRPDGVSIAAEFAPIYPPQQADESFGWFGNSQGYFSAPTPSAANGPATQSFVNPPTFSNPGGLFSQSFQLTLTPEQPGDTMRYTLNGTAPDATSPLYTAPITISVNTVVRAKSFRPGVGESDPGAGTYVKLESDVQGFSSDLPLMVLETFNTNVTVGTQSPGFLTVIDKDAVSGRTTLNGPAQLVTGTGLDVRGNTSANKAKKNYNVEFHDGRRQSVDYPVLGMLEESDWVLYGASLEHEPTLFANPFMYGLARAVGFPAPRTRFVELFLNADGDGVTMSDYRGIYVMMERPKRGSGRIDVEKLEPLDATEPAITGGYILRFNQNEAKNAPFVTNRGTLNYWTTFGFFEPKLPDLSVVQRNWMINYVNDFESALFGANFADPATGYRKYFDAQSLMDFQLLQEFSANNDAYHSSVYMSKERGKKLRMSMLWDFDWAFLFRPALSGWRYNATEYVGPQRGMFHWYERLYQDPQYLQEYFDRWAQFRHGDLSTAALHARLDGLGTLLAEAAARDHAKFGGATLAAQVSNMKTWVATRTDWMDSQLGGLAPILAPGGGEVPAGGQVSAALPSGAAGAIYYTTDGTDPRLPALPGETGNLKTLVPFGSTWKYLDSGSDQGTAWYAEDFNDSTWAAGPALLGYNSPGVVTTVGFIDTNPTAAGVQKNITTYFRHTFTANNPETLNPLILRLKRDDGAVVYLNGQELFRDALPDEVQITYQTLANGNSTATTDHAVPPAKLHHGLNVLAIEVHQTSDSSSDICLDVELMENVVSTGGGISPSAQVYAGPITLSQTTLVQARILNGSSWSPLTTALYLVGEEFANATNLAITEIMYHPDGTGVEYIELQNMGARRINLDGVYFADDNPFSERFTFGRMTLQPGEFCVVTNDLSAFQTLYGNGARLAGQFVGSLDNKGEHITLKEPNGTNIVDFAYGALPPWPVAADGAGHSLEPVILDPALYGYGSNWRPSSEIGGSPGYPGLSADADGDGVSDAAEIAFGSDPGNGTQRPVAPALSRNATTGAITLTWASQANRTYTVQCRDHLGDAWDSMDTVVAPGTSATYTDLNRPTSRFYRISTNL